jgi:hypothetical protein
MFYLIAGVPLGLLWAVLQFYLCKKEYKNIIKFLPALSSAALFIFAEVIRGENLMADAVYGMFGMGICLDSYVNNQGNVTVSGFPKNYPSGYDSSEQGIRFKAVGNITGKTENNLRLTYNADTAGGDSGGPVYVNESFVGTINGYSVSYDYNTVIAIHTQAGNTGVRINFDIMYFCYQNSYLTAV